MTTCDKAGCESASEQPEADGWHLPTEADTRNGHNNNAFTYCPGCWAACLRIGFTL